MFSMVISTNVAKQRCFYV